MAGTSGRPVVEFHGVPYAAPPIGPLRFRAPQPPVAWAATRDAARFGPAPMQSPSSPYSGVIPANSVQSVSEDCLTLDVWAPAEPGEYPVLVWVPGGAYLTGGSSLETYDGSRLAADENVVVVGVNYRLGVLGFGWFGAEAGDSNCGLRDLLAALAWVRRNIGAFGGDPGRVTAMGESAGAGALLHLLASPAIDGLADRFILRSPGVDHTLYPDDAERVTDALLAQLSLARTDIGRLAEIKAEGLVAAQEAVVLEMLPVLSSMPFHPFVDGDLLPATPSQALAAGAGSAFDLMLSWTTDEMRLYPNPTADAIGPDGLVPWTRRMLTRRMGSDPGTERARRLVDFYVDRLAGGGGVSGSKVWAAISTDGVMRLPARRIADAHARHGGNTLVSEFAWHGPAPDGEWDRGAFHAIDLPFTFGTLDVGNWRSFLNATDEAVSRSADEVAQQLMHALVQFAATGEPEVPGGGPWPRYDAATRSTVVFASPCRIDDDPLAEVAAAWDGLWTPAARAPAM
jgi:para-nitrobenzyl esterase